MSSIDDRVVRMEFDNKQFEDGVNTTMTTLQKLNNVLQFRNGSSGFEDIQKASDALTFDPLTNRLWQVQQNFSFFGEFVRTLFDRISNSIINVGSTMFRELTTAPLRAGFAEYELQMTSTQTIMASTGKSIEEVTAYLDELNTYADKTIYSFSDMTANIGKFTNAGVELDTAVAAIQGISNEAALSGANAAEASRAMYNFAQALSAGYVKLIDWKSIENANMATKQFKEQLLETAVEMGTVERAGDGMYRVLSRSGQGGTMSELISATHLFNDSLSYQWMTSEVLTTTLGKYADQTTEIGRAAFAAATEVKTFSQLIDTVKEALGSGWTKSISYIIGNLEEAKVLWTGVNEEISAILDPIAEAREEMLKFWHDNGGRDAAIKAITDAWHGLKAIMDAIGGAFEKVFPPMTGERLVEITNNIADLAAKFNEFATDSMFLSDLGIFFENIFSVVRRIASELGNVISVLFERLSPVADIFSEFGSALYEGVYWLGLFLGGIARSEDPFKTFSMTISSLKNAIGYVVSGIENLVKGLLDLVGIHIDGSPISDLFDRLAKLASDHIDLSFLKGLPSLSEGLSKALDGLGAALSSILNTIIGGLSSGLDYFVDILDRFFTAASNAAEAGGELAGSFDVLGALKTVFGGLPGIISSAGSAIMGFVSWIGENLPKLFEFLGSEQLHGIIANFTSLMGGKLLMSLSNFIDVLKKGKEASEGGGPFAAIKEAFDGITDKISKTFESLTDAISGFQEKIHGKDLKSIAIAIGILAVSIALLASIDSDKMANGIAGIGAAMGVLIGSMKALEIESNLANPRAMSALATSLIKMAVAAGILALSVKLLSGIDMDSLQVGLIGVVSLIGALTVSAIAMSRFSGKIATVAKGMVGFAIAIGILALSVSYLGNMDSDSLATGLTGTITLLGLMAAVAIALGRFGGNTTKAVKGVVGLAVSVGILVLSVKALSELDTDGLEKGLLGVVVLLGTLAAVSQYFEGGSFSLAGVATILAFAIAVKILESSVSVFAGMDWDSLGIGLLSVFALMAALGSFAVFIGNSSLTVSAAASVVVLALVIKMLADVVKSMSGMSWQELSVGLGAIAGSVALLVAALLVLEMGSNSMLVGAAAMTVMAIALRLFVPVIQKLGGMDVGGIIKAFITLGLSLAALAIGAQVLATFSPAIFTAATAIAAFGGACIAFGLGISVVAAGITALGVALAASAAVIVAGAEAISVGIITIISAVVVAIFKGLADGVVALLTGIGDILGALGVAIHAIGDFIVENIPYMLSVVATLILSLLALIPQFIPQLVAIIGQFVVALVMTLVAWIPTIAGVLVTGVVTLINSIANGVRDNSEAILAAVRNILSSIIELVLTGLAEIVRMIPGVGDTLAGFIEDGREGVRQALAPESFGDMGGEAVGSVTESMAAESESLNSTANEIGQGAHDSFEDGFIGDGENPAAEIMDPMLESMQGFDGQFGEIASGNLEAYYGPFLNGDTSSIESFNSANIEALGLSIPQFGEVADQGVSEYGSHISQGNVSSEATSLSSSGVSGLNQYIPQWGTAGTNSVEGFANSLDSGYALSLVRQSASNLGNEALRTFRNTMQVQSPSRATMKIGKYTTQGFAIGIGSLTELVHDESVGVGQTALDGIRDSLGTMSRYLAEDVEYDPTIRPVMDLSEIQNGIGLMNRIVDNGVPQPLLGVGLDAYPQSMLSAMGGSSAFGAFSSRGDTTEESTYNIYIDSNALMTDARLNNAFEGFMREIVRKADM